MAWLTDVSIGKCSNIFMIKILTLFAYKRLTVLGNGIKYGRVNGGDIYFSDGESNARGVAILLKRNIVIENVNVNPDKEGRKLQLKFDLKEKSFEICNIYAPNQDDPAFFIDVLNNIQDSEVDFPIICGDLNVYLNELKDVKSFQCNRGQSSSSKVLNAFMDEYEWVDIWRVLYPDVFQLTWKRRGLSSTMS